MVATTVCKVTRTSIIKAMRTAAEMPPSCVPYTLTVIKLVWVTHSTGGVCHSHTHTQTHTHTHTGGQGGRFKQVGRDTHKESCHLPFQGVK